MSAVLLTDETKLRLMRESDIAAVVGIETRSYDFPWSDAIFSDCLRVGYCCWVVEQGASVCGYGIMSVAAQESHILNICIAPEARRLGAARMLMLNLLELAANHHARISFLEVRPSNSAAIRLYESLGFRRVGTRKGYYPAKSGREDALVMSTPLDDVDRISVRLNVLA